MNNPLISIIMPVYNNEKYVSKAVDSVLSQDFCNFELIIINDGSTDKTPQIADAFADKDSRVRVIHQKNQWMYASINNGIEKAKGEYVYVLNSDDTLTVNALKTLSDIVVKYDPDVIWTKINIYKCDENQNIIDTIDFHLDNAIDDCFYKNIDEVRNNYILFYKYLFSGNQANLYRRSIAIGSKHKNIFFGEDLIFNIDIANDINSAYVCKTPIYNHFYYQKVEINASLDKWYGYEHEMYNLFYSRYCDLLKSWNAYDNEAASFLSETRLNDLKKEFKIINNNICKLTLVEKIKFVFFDAIDDIIYSCALKTNRLHELEYRIFSTCNELLQNKIIDEGFEFYFIYEMLKSLLGYTLRYEKKTEDLVKFKDGVYHKKNYYNIGKSIYEELVGRIEEGNV